MSEPLVTVCVSTRNRAHLLPRLLDALEVQTLRPEDFEVVVVDDGSDDDTWPTLQQRAVTSALRLVVHRNPVSRGAAAGRNVAWRAGTGRVCAFTDDDCLPMPDWLERGLAATAAGDVVLAGAVEPPAEQWVRMTPFSRHLLVTPAVAKYGATANLFVRRDSLERVGGFDESFRRSCEDTDLTIRLMKSGAAFAFDRDVLVLHEVSAPAWARLVREQKRWRDLPLVFARHPDQRDRLLIRKVFWKTSHERLLLLAFGLLALRRSPAISLALAAPWLHERLCINFGNEVFAERVLTLPGVMVLDAAEIVALVRGSIEHRTLIL